VRGLGFGVSKTDVARRIATILVLGTATDANYNAVKLATWDLAKSAKA
jgi:hypothetical protein